MKPLRLPYQTALGVGSRGVTLHELAQEPHLRGYQLPTPKVWLHAQFALPFHKVVLDPQTFSLTVQTIFGGW